MPTTLAIVECIRTPARGAATATLSLRQQVDGSGWRALKAHRVPVDILGAMAGAEPAEGMELKITVEVA